MVFAGKICGDRGKVDEQGGSKRFCSVARRCWWPVKTREAWIPVKSTQTITDWKLYDKFPYSLAYKFAEDSVTKFTSLVRARDKLVLVNYRHWMYHQL